MAMNLLYLSCRPRRLPAIVLSTSLGIDPSPLALNISSSGTVIHPIVSVILRKLSPSHVVALRIIFADLLDNFQIDDPNGTHEVLVSELTGYPTYYRMVRDSLILAFFTLNTHVCLHGSKIFSSANFCFGVSQSRGASIIMYLWFEH